MVVPWIVLQAHIKVLLGFVNCLFAEYVKIRKLELCPRALALLRYFIH
jgi:hypothetical protein